MYKEITGDLISLAKEGYFDVIAHGCNCFCSMQNGIAPLLVEAFDIQNTAQFDMEGEKFVGEYNKLGNFQAGVVIPAVKGPNGYLKVANCYTQYYNRTEYYNHTKEPVESPLLLDYAALTLCLRKLNHRFKGKKIGLPKIGAGLAGGNWELIKKIIQEIMVDCDITVVILPK